MKTARKGMVAAIAFVIIGLASPATSRSSLSGADSPLNPEHISRLPKEVTRTLARVCVSMPSVAHYFATYLENSRLISLHYEHVHCQTRQPLCTQAGCLHELYVLDGTHYRLLRSYYGTRND
jgi:hypothetical protein